MRADTTAVIQTCELPNTKRRSKLLLIRINQLDQI